MNHKSSKKILISLSALSIALMSAYATVDASTTAAANTTNNLDIHNSLLKGQVKTYSKLVDLANTTPTLLSNLTKLAIANFRSANPNAVLRMDDATGTVDLIRGLAVPLGGDRETAALNFIAQHRALFGDIDITQLQLNHSKSKAALGGYLLRFDQVYDGVKIEHAGIGVVIDGNNILRAVLGPVLPATFVNAQPTLTADSAVALARQDLNRFAKLLPTQALDTLNSAFTHIANELGVFATPHPELRIVNTQNGARLAWLFYNYSQNPFGVFRYLVDAHSGEILYREDHVRRAEEQVTDQHADYFPTFPAITEGLKNDCAILDANGTETGKPDGMLRIKLRKFDDSNRVTGTEGVLTGKHANIQNALPTKLPFAQAAAGTYYFDKDNAPLTGRTNERNHLAEPAEHQDGISQFIYITHLLEYLDYLHKQGDAVHNRGFGSGSFPDNYPNEATPLSGTVHIPNVLDVPTDVSAPDFVERLLGLDNAFAVPLSQEIGGQEVVINPTFYGHGYLFNNLAIDFSVPMHEGTHATITPIAGFEGSPEGGALNEGQADLWAYTIGETPDLGTYPVNACKLRAYLSANNIDPNSYKYIRSAQSQIRYSQLGTRANTFEVHRDGEIYAGAMWDLREFMTALYPTIGFVRPDPVSGEATKATSLGKETWERLFLGSMYLLGLTSPDTMVKARDAVLIADAMLYPANPMDIHSKGLHEALIERMFAARELGINAKAPLGGRQTISSAVSDFASSQVAPTAPQGVKANIIDAKTIEVTWQPVAGAMGYQVLKRRGLSPARLFAGVPNRQYYDGDAKFAGYSHVEYVTNGATSYRDHGQAIGVNDGAGLDTLNYQYVVRAIGVSQGAQVGFSPLSGTAVTALTAQNVTKDVSTPIANVQFDGYKFSFDQSIVNNSNKVFFSPIEFSVIKISDASVMLLNAENGGTGQTGNPGIFTFAQSLNPGVKSASRRLEFANPNARLFTFDARVKAMLKGTAKAANGSQDSMDNSPPVDKPANYHSIAEYTGLVAIGTAGTGVADGVDYKDVVFTAKPSAIGVVATLSAEPDVAGVYPDLDFELRDSNGNVLATSGNLGPNEQVGGALIGGQTYVLRVIGWANGPTQFKIHADQLVTDPADANTTSTGANNNVTETLMRFTVNPLTGTIINSLVL